MKMDLQQRNKILMVNNRPVSIDQKGNVRALFNGRFVPISESRANTICLRHKIDRASIDYMPTPANWAGRLTIIKEKYKE